MWVFGIGQNLNTIPEFSYSKFSQEHKNKEITKVTHSSFEEGEIIIIELEPEIEVELDLFSIPSKSINFKNTKFKESPNSYSAQLSSSKETIPLYDLYCNWKFHLS